MTRTYIHKTCFTPVEFFQSNIDNGYYKAKCNKCKQGLYHRDITTVDELTKKEMMVFVMTNTIVISALIVFLVYYAVRK